MNRPSRVWKLCHGAAVLSAVMLLAGCGLKSQDPSGEASDDDSLFDPTGRKIAALGRIEPQSRIIQLGTSLPDRIAEVLVGEGAEVAAGAELVRLESHAERLAERNQLTAELADAQRRLKAETEYHESAVEVAQLTLTNVEQLRPLEIEAQEAQIRALKAELETAQKDLTRTENLLELNSISRHDVDHDRLQHQLAREKLSSAELELTRMKAAMKLDRTAAQAEVRRAQAALNRAQASVAVEPIRQQLTLAEARLEQTVLAAPIDGSVVRILKRAGEQAASGPVLQLADLKQMQVVAEVYETDVKRVAVGQKCLIRSPALPGELTGIVAEIGLQVFKNDVLGVDPAADADARVVEVRIDLDDDASAARFSNLQVDVEIDGDDSQAESVEPAA